MSIKNFLFSLVITFFFITSTNSQAKVYVDESMNKIDSIQFKKKCNTYILKCLKFTSDSVIVNKVLHKYSFGVLKKDEHLQLRKFLISDSNLNIDDTKTLLIKFRDTIYSPNSLKQINDKHNRECEKENPNISHLNKTLKQYYSERKKWIKSTNKCIKRIEKKLNSKVIHLYKYNKDAVSSYANFVWIKDTGVIKNKFFNIMHNYNLLILKPDGEYFLSGNFISDGQINQLLKNKDWTTFKNDFKSSITKNTTNGKGFFNKKNGIHKSHCF